MLGKLARWLRLCGNYVHYADDFLDDHIVAILHSYANQSETLFLTRDRELYRRTKRLTHSSVLIRATSVLDQLKQLISSEYGDLLEWNPFLARCAICSGNLQKIVSMDELSCLIARHGVQPGYDYYLQCSDVSCSRIYWRGLAWKDAFMRLCSILDDKRLLSLMCYCEMEEDIDSSAWARLCVQTQLRKRQ